MTEAEWLAAEDPAPVLAFLNPALALPGVSLASPRKLRLFACACCRQVWRLLSDPRSRRAVEVAERFADGLATDVERELAVPDDLVGEPGTAGRYAGLLARDCLGPFRPDGVWHPPGGRNFPLPAAAQAALLRDVFGNPFRPPPNLRCHWCGAIDTPRPVCPRCGTDFGWLPHGPPADLIGIALRAYDCHDFAVLPVLADALEEAGCEDGPLLWHLRGQSPCARCGGSGRVPPSWAAGHGGRPDEACRDCAGSGVGPWHPATHARGCWALDLVLGKS